VNYLVAVLIPNSHRSTLNGDELRWRTPGQLRRLDTEVEVLQQNAPETPEFTTNLMDSSVKTGKVRDELNVEKCDDDLRKGTANSRPLGPARLDSFIGGNQ
jgi:hypothetical protein